MLSFDSVKSRLEREQGLTFLEFNYSILQSYDFRELNRRHGVNLQMGGSDQWGNIVSGVDLVRRTDAKAVFGLTTPLLTTASGAKMGKTARGAVWLSRRTAVALRLLAVLAEHGGRPMSGASCGSSPTCHWRKSARLEALGGAEINEAKEDPGDRGDDAQPRRRGRAGRRRDGAAGFRGGGWRPTACRASRCRWRTCRRAFRLSRFWWRAGLAATNGEARRLIRGGGAQAQRRAVHRGGADRVSLGPS